MAVIAGIDGGALIRDGAYPGSVEVAVWTRAPGTITRSARVFHWKFAALIRSEVDAARKWFGTEAARGGDGFDRWVSDTAHALVARPVERPLRPFLG